MGDLVWVRIFFFSQTSGDRITYNAIVWQVFPCKIFFPRNQSAGYFFLKSPIPPSKVKGRPPSYVAYETAVYFTFRVSSAIFEGIARESHVLWYKRTALLAHTL